MNGHGQVETLWKERRAVMRNPFEDTPALGPLEPYRAEVNDAAQWNEEYVSGRWDFLGHLG